MSRAVLVLAGQTERQRAHAWIEQAPLNSRIELKAPRRSSDQNALMWVLLTEVARQHLHHGVRLSPDDWKLMFLSALKQEMRLVPNLDGTGFVNLGRSSSDLSKAEMGDLITLIQMFGAQHGIDFGDQLGKAAA